MSSPPRIWLDYRPVRIGWVVSNPDVAQLTAAARSNSCLWGGRFNPVIPMNDRGLSDKLIRLFGVDVLLPVTPTDDTKAFIDSYPHLHFHMWTSTIFNDRRCEFVDIRHAVKRAVRQASVGPASILGSIVRPVWSPADPLARLFDVLLGCYPEAGEITINAIVPGPLIKSVVGICDQMLAALQTTGRHPPPVKEITVPEMFRRFGADEWDVLRERFRAAPDAAEPRQEPSSLRRS